MLTDQKQEIERLNHTIDVAHASITKLEGEKETQSQILDDRAQIIRDLKDQLDRKDVTIGWNNEVIAQKNREINLRAKAKQPRQPVSKDYVCPVCGDLVGSLGTGWVEQDFDRYHRPCYLKKKKAERVAKLRRKVRRRRMFWGLILRII